MSEPTASRPADRSGSVSEARTASANGPGRRAFLIGGGAAVLAGTALGVGLGFATGGSEAAPPPPAPPKLVEAIAHEVTLIALIDAVSDAPATKKALLAQVRADHVEHERVLRGLLPYGTAPITITTPPMTAASVSAVRSTEKRAAQVAAQAAATFDGSTAVLLACISACEASHAELLS